MASRTFGLAKLVEEALTRPAHRPNPIRPHVADEYADIADHASDVNGRHQNRWITDELRRVHRGRLNVAITVGGGE